MLSTALGMAESGVKVGAESGVMYGAVGVAGGVVVMDKGPHPASPTATPMPSQNTRRIVVNLVSFIFVNFSSGAQCVKDSTQIVPPTSAMIR